MKSVMSVKPAILGVLVLATSSVPAEKVYDTYTISETETATENMFADQLNVSGTLIVSSNTKVSAGTLNLGGTPSVPAVLQVGGASSTLYVTNIVIGANGGCGLLRSTGYWSSITLREKLTIAENTPLSPESEFIDFLEVNQYCMATGHGFYNETEHPARIRFKRNAGGGIGWLTTGAQWGAYLFKTGKFVMEGTEKAPVWVSPGGGGGSFDAERYPSKLAEGQSAVETAGKCDVWFSTDNELRCLQLSNVKFMNEGRVLVTNIGVKITGPVFFGEGISSIEFGGSEDGYLDLNGNVLTSRTMRVAAGRVKSSAKGGVLAFAPGLGRDYVFSGTVDAPVSVRMCGGGVLSIKSSTISGLEVEKGTVRITDSNVSVASLHVASGAGIVIDGCEFVWPESADCPEGAVTCVNGGSVVFAKNASMFNPDISGGISKAGSGKVIVYDPVGVGGLLHVAEGTLSFSREGLDAPYHRWTFKELSDKSTNPKVLILSELYLWGNDGNRVPASGTMTKVDGLPEPSNLAAGQIAWQCEVTYNTTESWLMNIASIFNVGHNRPVLDSPVIKPEDPSTWVSFAYHLPDNSTPVTHYDLCTEKCRPRTWTFEASDDGKTWNAVDVRQGVEPVDNTGYICYFDGGDYLNPAKKFRLSGYETKGVLNMPPAVSVRVDAGATLDFTSVEGGQGVNAITVDIAAGCGMLKNAKAVAEGTLNLIATEPIAGATDIGFPVSNLSDADNLFSWKVVVNGKERKGWHVVSAGDTLCIVPPGTVVIIR